MNLTRDQRFGLIIFILFSSMVSVIVFGMKLNIFLAIALTVGGIIVTGFFWMIMFKILSWADKGEET